MKENTLLYAIIAILIVLSGAFLYVQKMEVDEMSTDKNQEEVTGRSEAALEAIAEGGYVVSTEETVVHWQGSKPFLPNYIEKGTLDVKEGTVTVDENGTVTGKMVFDMDTITTEEAMGGKLPEYLISHLKSKDFFDVEKYPTAEFEITSATRDEASEDLFQYVVTGDMTIKEKTHEISFLARIFSEDGRLVAEATTQLDRTLWDIRYGSNNFFEDLGDSLIDDLFTVSFRLVAKSE